MEYFWTAACAFIGGVLFVIWLTSRSKARKPPKLAGTAIPELGEGIDISKLYDIVYSGDYGTSFVERLVNVRIIGYVGGDDDETVSKMYMRGRWLAVEFLDGRRTYLMPHAITSLQESDPGTHSPVTSSQE